jgi:hypothetical protein
LEELCYFVHIDIKAKTIKISLQDIATESTTELNLEGSSKDEIDITEVLNHHLT